VRDNASQLRVLASVRKCERVLASANKTVSASSIEFEGVRVGGQANASQRVDERGRANKNILIDSGYRPMPEN